MSNNEQKVRFVKALAKFISGNEAKKSIWLQMGNELAQEWAEVRGASPVRGYGSVSETEKLLAEFLGVSL